MEVTKLVHVIKHLQDNNPNMRLCGSAALILAGVLEDRIVGDLDFALNRKDFLNIKDVKGLYLKLDYYKELNDEYKCYYGHSNCKVTNKTIKVNLLVFEDDVILDIDSIMYSNINITTQQVDTMLRWKKKYNRIKDIKDLNNIANKYLENILIE